MIFISPKGMTVTEWLKEKRRLNKAQRNMWKGEEQKRTERVVAKRPLFGRTRMFFGRILSTGRKS